MPDAVSLRTFFAVATPCPAPLARVLKELERLGSALKCAAPRGLHCTLKFLGPTSPDTAAALGAALPGALADCRPFSAELQGVGTFPNAERPTVVWAGLAAPELIDLQQKLESLAAGFGFVPENRPFHPHVTLARVKYRPPPQLRQLLEQHATTRWGTFDVTAVEFLKSTPTPAGSRYEVLATATLRSAK